MADKMAAPTGRDFFFLETIQLVFYWTILASKVARTMWQKSPFKFTYIYAQFK